MALRVGERLVTEETAMPDEILSLVLRSTAFAACSFALIGLLALLARLAA
jgi:hypothetical protein